MRLLGKIGFWVVLPLILLGCVRPPPLAPDARDMVGKTLNLPRFTAIESSGPFSFQIVGGQRQQRVQLTGAVAALGNVQAKVRHQTLYLSYVPARHTPDLGEIGVKIRLRTLSYLNLVEGGNVSGKKINSPSLVVHMSGNSRVQLQGMMHLKELVDSSSGLASFRWIDSDHLRLEGSGSGRILLAGVVNHFNVRLQDSVQLDGRNLRAKNVYIEGKDTAMAEISPLNHLNAFAEDQSNIYYFTHPKAITRETQDSGDVLFAGNSRIPQ